MTLDDELAKHRAKSPDMPTLWDIVATEVATLIEHVGPFDTIQARFEQFHAYNPDVYREFVRLAREYQRRGYPRVGIGHLTEILRWQRRMDTYDPASEFKITNDYRSRYARLIMEQEPDLDGFITIRSLRAE